MLKPLVRMRISPRISKLVDDGTKMYLLTVRVIPNMVYGKS